MNVRNGSDSGPSPPLQNRSAAAEYKASGSAPDGEITPAARYPSSQTEGATGTPFSGHAAAAVSRPSSAVPSSSSDIHPYRQTPGFQSFGHRRAEQQFERLPGLFVRLPVVLQFRHTLLGMHAPDDGGLLDTVPRCNGRHCHNPAAIPLHYPRESLRAGPVGQPAQKPHRTPGGTCKR